MQIRQIHLSFGVHHAREGGKIQVTERQFEILEEFLASRTAAVRLVQYAKIVLLAFAKHNNDEIGEIVELNPQQVSVWRKRWRDEWSRAISVECSEPRSVLKNAIETLFADLPRKGQTPTFATEQQAAIVAISCENPSEESERPISQFTAREIAAETVKREIVPSISPTTVWSFLKSGRCSAASK